MDRFEAMSILLEVVEAGSLSGAGRRLGLPLSTVSRKISDLEAHLKTRLLSRSTRRLDLTDAGRSYVEACRRILEEVEEAERAAAGEYSAPRGELIVTAPIVFGRLHLLPVVTAFLNSYPEVSVRLLQADRVAHLLEDHIDLAVRIGDLPASSLIAARLGAIRRVICASPAYFAARGAPQSPEELTTHDCIAFEALSSGGAWDFGIGQAAKSVRIQSRLVVNTAEAAIDAAIAGFGVTRVLSYQVAEAVRTGALRLALESFEPAAWPVSLVRPERGRLPLKLRAFLDFAAPRLKARLAFA